MLFLAASKGLNWFDLCNDVALRYLFPATVTTYCRCEVWELSLQRPRTTTLMRSDYSLWPRIRSKEEIWRFQRGFGDGGPSCSSPSRL